jgi:two-component system chemotaxis sensor kinase CheA
MPILALVLYRGVVGDLFSKDKINYVYDAMATRNSKHKLKLDEVFKKNRIYDELILRKLRSRVEAESIIESLILNDKELKGYYIFTEFNRSPRVYLKKTAPKLKLVAQSSIDSLWRAKKNELQLMPFQDHKYLMAEKYERNNRKYMFVKIIDFTELFEGEDGSVVKFVLVNEKQDILFETFGLGKARSFLKSPDFAKLNKERILKATKADIEGDSYVLAYSAVDSGLSLITILPEQEILAALKELNIKSIIILIIIIAAAGLISLYASRELTKTVEELSAATKQIKSGDYSISIKNKSKDEMGELAKSFETMSSEIQELMGELKAQNEVLEETVLERTAQLNNTLNLQKAMVDSLNEGFMIMNKNGVFSATYTKSCETIFKQSPSKQFIGDLFNIPEEEHDDLRSMCEVLVSEKAPFEDMKNYLPDYLRFEDGRIVLCDYVPMHKEDGKMSGIVVTVEDKTKEIQALEESKRQKNHAEMVITILKDKNNYFDFVDDLKIFIRSIKEPNTSSTSDQDLILRHVHTFKGVSSYFKLNELTSFLDNYETKLETEASVDHLATVIELEELLIKQCAAQEEWLGQNAFKSNWEKSHSVSYDVLKKFAIFMKTEDVPAVVYRMYVDNLASRPLMTIFDKYDDLLKYLSISEGIKLSKVEWNGFDIKVPVSIYHDLFNTFVHFYRNIMSHAFEGRRDGDNIVVNTAELIKNGKQKSIKITIADNGNGIDLEKIRKTMKVEGSDQINLLNKIFEDHFTMAEGGSHLSGRGVGLSAFKEKLSQLGGRVEVISSKGKGTKFEIYLPYINDYTIEGASAWDKVA